MSKSHIEILTEVLADMGTPMPGHAPAYMWLRKVEEKVKDVMPGPYWLVFTAYDPPYPVCTVLDYDNTSFRVVLMIFEDDPEAIRWCIEYA